MRSRLLSGGLVAVSLSSLVLIAAGCRQGTDDQAQRLKKVETSVTEIPAVVARVKTLEGKEGGMSTELSTLQGSVRDLEAKIAAFEEEVGASASGTQDLKRKAEDLTSRVTAVSAKADAAAARIGPLEQKVALLQTRYEDHLRKYHSGG